VDFAAGAHAGKMEVVKVTEELPYPSHTNRELGMMLRAEKPLAVFTDGYENFPDSVRRYLRLFDRHVTKGRFVKREYVLPENEPRKVLGWHTILYALPSEEWRIDAMIELKLSGQWSSKHEREEGRLLGYKEWQNDAWLSRRAASQR
jgi:hypothetical protein